MLVGTIANSNIYTFLDELAASTVTDFHRIYEQKKLI